MVPNQRILLIAAEPREFDGLLRFCSEVRKLPCSVYWARSGRLRDLSIWMLANGAGASHAAYAVDLALSCSMPDTVVSVGFCGALDPVLAIGDVFVATAVDAPGLPRFPTRLPRSSFPHSTGVLASIDHVAQTAVEKSQLRAAGASAVEMEAAGVAERAAQYGIPLVCIRSVTDTSNQTFALDYNRALRSDGHFATINLLASALGKPGKAFPELFRLRRSCRIATRTLGEFIAGCQF